MIERLEEEALQTISIPLQELIWLKKGKEILISNKRFDVKEIALKKNMAFVSGLFDDEEEALVKKINKQHSSQQTVLLKIWFPVFKSLPRELNTVTPMSWLKNEYQIYCSLKLPSTLLQVITPPPKA